MHKTHRAIASYTAQPNTPESDRQRYVLHHVTVTVTTETGSHEETVVRAATDPMSAIDDVNAMSTAEYMQLARVTPR
jgi:hypothetical protein